jgi:Ca2+-binding RTX toxin-like protein
MRRFAFVTAAFLIAAMGAFAAPAGAAAPKCNGKTATKWLTSPGTLDGTDGPDVLVGTSGSDSINGYEENDLICGLGGDDILLGGPGDDLLFGGSGNDELNGQDGDDTNRGGSGNDFLHEYAYPYEAPYYEEGAYTGDDTYYGESGNDWINDVDGDHNYGDGGSGSDNVRTRGQAHGGSGDDPNVEAFESVDHDGNAYATGGSGNDGWGGGYSDLDYVAAHGGIVDGGSGNDKVKIVRTGKALGGSGSDFVDGDPLDEDLNETDSHYLDCGSGFDEFRANGPDVVRRCERDQTQQ